MKSFCKFIQIVFVLAIITTKAVIAQPPDPSGGAGGSGNNDNNRVGGSAPVGNGMVLLIGLGLAYAGKKTFILTDYEKNKMNRNEPKR